MKKVVSMILMTAMILTMTSVMTSCGKEEASSKEPTSQVTNDTGKTDTQAADDTGKADTQVTDDTGKTDTQAADDTKKNDVQNAPGENSVLPKAIEDAESISFPGIMYSGWELSSGKEMAESIRKAILEINGGAFMLCFVDESTAVLGTGAGSFTGTYEAMDENNAIHIVFAGILQRMKVRVKYA